MRIIDLPLYCQRLEEVLGRETDKYQAYMQMKYGLRQTKFSLTEQEVLESFRMWTLYQNNINLRPPTEFEDELEVSENKAKLTGFKLAHARTFKKDHADFIKQAKESPKDKARVKSL